MARLATGLETLTHEELTEQVNMDVRALGALPLHKRKSRGGVKLCGAAVSDDCWGRDVG